MYTTWRSALSHCLVWLHFAPCLHSLLKKDKESVRFFHTWMNHGPMLVAFIILWIILAKFGWPLFDGMLKKREDTIKNSLEKSEEARQESERLLAEYREQLEGAKAQAQQMLNNARQSCDAMESEAKQKAQEEAAAIVAKAKVAIEAEKQSAISELKGSVVDLSVDIATRVIGEDFSDEEHRKLIERYVKEAGSLNA